MVQLQVILGKVMIFLALYTMHCAVQYRALEPRLLQGFGIEWCHSCA